MKLKDFLKTAESVGESNGALIVLLSDKSGLKAPVCASKELISKIEKGEVEDSDVIGITSGHNGDSDYFAVRVKDKAEAGKTEEPKPNEAKKTGKGKTDFEIMSGMMVSMAEYLAMCERSDGDEDEFTDRIKEATEGVFSDMPDGAKRACLLAFKKCYSDVIAKTYANIMKTICESMLIVISDAKKSKKGDGEDD